jgi:Tol biopolymer transport system component
MGPGDSNIAPSERDAGWAFRLAVSAALVAALALALLIGWPPSRSAATFPGTNGKIFFSSGRDGNLEIYSMNPDGSDETRLTRTTGDEVLPSVSANGRWVAFAHLPDPAAEPGQRIRIEVMREDGSDRRQVTGSTTSADFSPGFSPDGSTLLFSRETDRATENSRLWTVGVDGRGASQLVAISPFREYESEYFPGGNRIAYVQELPAGEPRIYTVRSAGTDPEPISPDGRGPSFSPSTSPDGSSVAWAGYETTEDRDSLIAVTTLSTAETRTVVPATGSVFVDHPTWSPAGNAIAFERVDDNQPDAELQIFRVSPEGGPSTDLTGPSTAPNLHPFWAPRPVRPSFRVLRKPRPTTESRRATFRFRAVGRGTRLRCRLDSRKARICRAGRRVTFRGLGRGGHRLRVTPLATDRTAKALGLNPRVVGQARNIRWRVR